MEIVFHSNIAEIDARQWNQFIQDNNPFLRHEFLLAAEQHHCVGENFGWIPRHLANYNNGNLIASMPLYEKYNSYGEFVFDHSWADAYSRNGLNYFPKLVTGIPYTPANGQRILCAPQRRLEIYPIILRALQQLLESNFYSGWHLLFAINEEQQWFEQQQLLTRHDCQYHWFNEHYECFDQFLSQLSSRKRKNIRKERSSVIEQGISFRQLNGHNATAEDIQQFTTFYNRTFEEKWGIATFNNGFFMQLAKTIPDNLLLVMADQNNQCIAGALMYTSDTRLYGRHWGSTENINNLHFETCYYQGIDFCIAHGLNVFEPGAQGEHKVARGFRPVTTRSCHLLNNSPLYPAIAKFCQDEQLGVQQYIDELNGRLPFKKQ